jgi:hypothetical protein
MTSAHNFSMTANGEYRNGFEDRLYLREELTATIFLPMQRLPSLDGRPALIVDLLDEATPVHAISVASSTPGRGSSAPALAS